MTTDNGLNLPLGESSDNVRVGCAVGNAKLMVALQSEVTYRFTNAAGLALVSARGRVCPGRRAEEQQECSQGDRQESAQHEELGGAKKGAFAQDPIALGAIEKPLS